MYAQQQVGGSYTHWAVPSVEVTVPTHRLGSNVVLSPIALSRFPKAADALIYLAISIH